MSPSVRRLTRDAVLTALALSLSVAEGLVPIAVLLPLPGLRLGLSSLVTLYALCRLNKQDALMILLARCLLGALLGGNLSALAFSLSGGLLSFFTMSVPAQPAGAVSVRHIDRGAAAHNTGQIIAAVALLGTSAPVVYLPPLLLASILTGAVTGAICTELVWRVPKILD
jgi:heptaprenyl diphosphate synthase